MALTAAQIAYIRSCIGNVKADSAGAYEVTAANLQAIYDDTEQGNGDLNTTIVWALRWRWGMAINDTATYSDLGTNALNQKPAQIKKLLDYWEGVTGMAGGQTIGRGSTNVYRADSRQTEEPDYSNGTSSEDDDAYIVIYTG
jgi:hypothetical protein